VVRDSSLFTPEAFCFDICSHAPSLH
jgi:hypothetical protein